MVGTCDNASRYQALILLIVTVTTNAGVVLEELVKDPENEGAQLKAPQSVLNNYFSIGSDANTALQVCKLCVCALNSVM